MLSSSPALNTEEPLEISFGLVTKNVADKRTTKHNWLLKERQFQLLSLLLSNDKSIEADLFPTFTLKEKLVSDNPTLNTLVQELETISNRCATDLPYYSSTFSKRGKKYSAKDPTLAPYSKELIDFQEMANSLNEKLDSCLVSIVDTSTERSLKLQDITYSLFDTLEAEIDTLSDEDE